jgi:hypothetical protein
MMLIVATHDRSTRPHTWLLNVQMQFSCSPCVPYQIWDELALAYTMLTRLIATTVTEMKLTAECIVLGQCCGSRHGRNAIGLMNAMYTHMPCIQSNKVEESNWRFVISFPPTFRVTTSIQTADKGQNCSLEKSRE